MSPDSPVRGSVRSAADLNDRIRALWRRAGFAGRRFRSGGSVSATGCCACPVAAPSTSPPSDESRGYAGASPDGVEGEVLDVPPGVRRIPK